MLEWKVLCGGTLGTLLTSDMSPPPAERRMTLRLPAILAAATRLSRIPSERLGFASSKHRSTLSTSNGALWLDDDVPSALPSVE